MTFQQIVDLGIRRNTARLKLDKLIRRRLVHEEGRENWKQGKKLWYSLTEKGKKECMCIALNNLNESFKVVEKLTAELLSAPSRLEEWRKMSREAFFDVKITEDMPLEERFKRFNEYTEEWYGALRRALRSMHEIFIKICLPFAILKAFPDADYFIRINTRGGVHIIPEAIIKEKGL